MISAAEDRSGREHRAERDAEVADAEAEGELAQRVAEIGGRDLGAVR